VVPGTGVTLGLKAKRVIAIGINLGVDGIQGLRVILRITYWYRD
jgi:hypothetical protein